MQLSTPRNLGSIVRTSVELGLDRIFLYDKFELLKNDKAMKMVAKVSRRGRVDDIEVVDVDDPLDFVNGYDNRYVTALAKGCKKIGIDDFKFETDNSVIVFGNESEGVPREISRPHESTRVTIPNFGPENCLNLSIAYGIFLYEYCRQNPMLFPTRGMKKS